MPPKKKCPYCKKGHGITKCADAKAFLKTMGFEVARISGKELVKKLASSGADVVQEWEDNDYSFDFD